MMKNLNGNGLLQTFEMPILYDLSKNCLYYYKETPIWGQIYYEYFREYIIKNFS